MNDEIHVGDVVRTRKKHPCGSDIWEVTRNGADIKMKCQGCGRVVMLARDQFLKRRKAVLTAGTKDTFPSPAENDRGEG